ncbi:MAG: GIY-YIG nuclease family protein [Clostridia bacterium]|nr:GIY-YIG nuclease family protein [Clostridia bacterium]
MYYTYIVRCFDNSLYTGITTDLERRMREHREGTGAKYTASHRVTAICAAWQSEDRSNASRLENYIKMLKKAQKEALITGEASLFDLIPVDTEAYERVDVTDIIK